MVRTMLVSLCLAVIAATGALATSFAEPSDAFLDNCPGQEVMVTEAIRVGENVFNMTLPACPGFVPKEHAIHPKDSLIAKRSTHYIQSRSTVVPASTSPSECIQPGICQCGVSCSITCETFNTAPAPTVGDCEQLSSIVRAFSNLIGNTIVLSHAAPKPFILDFNSCRSAIGNIKTDGTLIEFCWDQFADQVNSMINGCLAPGPQDGALCHASNNAYETSIGSYAL